MTFIEMMIALSVPLLVLAVSIIFAVVVVGVEEWMEK